MTIQVRSLVAGSSFYNANQKLHRKPDNFKKDKSERNSFKKKEKDSNLAGEPKVGISWLMFFTAPAMRQLQEDKGQRIEEMDFRDQEPFTFRIYRQDHYLSLEHLGALIRVNKAQYLETEGPIDNESLKRVLCLIRDGTGRLDAVKQVQGEK